MLEMTAQELVQMLVHAWSF